MDKLKMHTPDRTEENYNLERFLNTAINGYLDEVHDISKKADKNLQAFAFCMISPREEKAPLTPVYSERLLIEKD